MSDYLWLLGWIEREQKDYVLQVTPHRVLTASTCYIAEIVELRVELSLVEDPKTQVLLVAEAESSNAEDALAYLREKIERGERHDKSGRTAPRKAADWEALSEMFAP